MAFRNSHTALALYFALVVCSVSHAQIVLEDPEHFEVANIWSGPNELGVPGNLAGMLFSPDGNLLYMVGASETILSAVYEVPVVRDPVTNKVIDLLPTTGIIYEGDPFTAGLDTGFEFGPEGTIFNTYWNANKIGERPGGLSGSETLFDMSAVGIPSSIAGLTFSPHVTDPATGFGQMLVSSWFGANLFEVLLTPLGGGLFEPEQSTVFVTLPFGGTGAIQFVPSGLLAGNLMYVNWDEGTVRVLTIDPATGLPIDQGTGQPTQGTTNPIDDLFASGLGVGPWGLEFDPLTNDFFVSTWSGNPVNSVIHISGLGFAIQVEVDIKPGSFPNSINRKSAGLIPVAILSSEAFNASSVDASTVTWAGAPVATKENGSLMESLEDINGDDIQDLLLHFSTQEANLPDGTTEAVLEGATFEGAPLTGSDSVRLVQ